MSDNNDKLLPIIGYGERLIEATEKRYGFGETTYPRSYNDARNRIKSQVGAVKASIQEIPEDKRMDEVVLTLRLNEKFLAKSYIPKTLFRNAQFENIGSRRCNFNDEEDVIQSKMHFIKVDMNSIHEFESILEANEDSLSAALKNDIRKVEDISMLTEEEIIQGFTEEWQEGTVEFILHPFAEENEKMIDKFKDILEKNEVDISTVKVKTYPNGPTFVSGYVSQKALQEISSFNPLRTVHPLSVNFFPELRSSQDESLLVKAPIRENVSEIKVGIFDGGIDPSHPLLVNYAKENKSVSTHSLQTGLNHGTAVAGVVLYGDLNQYSPGATLAEPVVSVESFRVLPLSDPNDLDLYEAIDFIEKIVPSRHDIQVYNLSFGPVGPISDDDLTRFTYSLDLMAWDYNKLFVVAVGNEGHLSAPYNRIQAPGDLVNGLGVGAYTYQYNTGEKIRAPYSSVGEGREGCKVKPDLVAFGGDRQFPIHLLSTDYSKRWLNAGTSFSSPLIASKAAEILGRCTQFNPIVARALLIHAAQHRDQVCNELGYGTIDQSVDEILKCDENRVTIIYSSSINPTAHAKLLIPLPLNAQFTGEVHLSWTITTMTKTNALHLEDYTESAIEDTFYPHSKKYKYTKDGRSRTLHIDVDAAEIARLENEDWSRSLLPVSSSAFQFQTEQARRGEMKWDTVMKKWKRMRRSSLENPFLVLHGLGRNESAERIDYAVAITISVPRYSGNLHEDILNEYRVLEPVFVRNSVDVMLPIR